MHVILKQNVECIPRGLLTRLGGVGNMSCKDACLSRFSLINLGEALSQTFIKMKWLRAIE